MTETKKNYKTDLSYQKNDKVGIHTPTALFEFP